MSDQAEDRLEGLARHLYNIAAGKLGMVQAVSWDHLTPYWRAGYRLLAAEAIKYMAKQEDKGGREEGTGQAG